MWKSKVFYGVLFTIVGFFNLKYKSTMNILAAIIMFLFAAESFNSAQKEYHKSKQNKN